MTRNRKLVIAGALAGLVGTTALAGMALADPERGYGRGSGYFGQMMGGYGPGQHMMGGYGPGRHMDGYGPGYGPGRHMDGDGPRGGHPMWGGRGNWRGHMGGGGPGFGGGPVMGRIFEGADADNDGKLTQDEIDTYRDARFSEFDTDGNGELSLEEFQALHQEMIQPMTVRAFQMHDPDGDAAITKDEFASRTQGLVQRLDRDGDGALSSDDRYGRGPGWGPMHRFYDNDDNDDDNDN